MMNNKGAINEIKQSGLHGNQVHQETLELALEALEKQIPIPPENKVNEKYPTLGRNYYCKCGVMFMDWENAPTNYCGNCGQRVKEDAENED